MKPCPSLATPWRCEHGARRAVGFVWPQSTSPRMPLPSLCSCCMRGQTGKDRGWLPATLTQT
eukprot:13299261-Alexandrium_andersonii.AAC.1